MFCRYYRVSSKSTAGLFEVLSFLWKKTRERKRKSEATRSNVRPLEKENETSSRARERRKLRKRTSISRPVQFDWGQLHPLLCLCTPKTKARTYQIDRTKKRGNAERRRKTSKKAFRNLSLAISLSPLVPKKKNRSPPLFFLSSLFLLHLHHHHHFFFFF